MAHVVTETAEGNAMPSYLTSCKSCGMTTSKKYAREHDGECKRCVEPTDSQGNRIASREEQHARYIDCGPAAWDDK